jgi:phage gpG-like protein
MSQVTFTSSDIAKVFDEIVDRFTKPKMSNIDVITNDMRLAISENFANESGNGEKWEPLAARTVAEREEFGFPGSNPILVRTGEFLKSLTNPNDIDHIERVKQYANGFEVEVGSKDYRTLVLNYGDISVPARPFLTMDASQEDRLSIAIEDYLDALF